MDQLTQVTIGTVIALVSFFLGRYSAKHAKKEEITLQRTASLIVLSIWVVLQIGVYLDDTRSIGNVFDILALGAGANILGLDLEKLKPWKK